ncbi:hypothetical protein F9L33_01260 [Amylibacter sp. SFDW26]|uniref:SPOR domain-containing protein n=1 Tax=Amylibacter sp. SFDW26 TaxID=2652722 RepID=UPI001261BC13|nr:SPOR domain-containing protein [Amylibacter sp. SFDW26]KAB7615424.1 hypothetical protein F9L33_01260 [Amylibacter sp. SFDW26]
MLKNKIMAVTIGLMLATTTANTQTLRSDNGPAERPPASFKGNQYVDSKGCVYIRAGNGARVSWVPRVNRSRNVFCSSRNKPSLSATQLAAISGKPATRVKKPVVKAKPAPKPVKTAAAPTVQAQKPVVQQKPRKAKIFSNPVIVKQPTVKIAKPKPAVKPQRVISQQAPLIITPQPPAPRKAVVKRPIKTQNTATRTRANRYAVRNGPQAVHPADLIASGRENGGEVLLASNTTSKLKSVRGYSADQRRANRNLAVRNGPQAVHPADVIRAANNGVVYKPAARSTSVATNVKNGKDPIHNITVYKSTIGSDVTPRGDAQMEMIWTNTVPRRLVTKVRARETVVPAAAKQQDIFRISSKSTKKAPKAAKLKARYVQLGTFGNTVNAKKTIALFQKRGQKVSTRAIKRNGKSYRVIFLGPFTSSTQAKNAMASAKSAGYRDAFFVR